MFIGVEKKNQLLIDGKQFCACSIEMIIDVYFVFYYVRSRSRRVGIIRLGTTKLQLKVCLTNAIFRIHLNTPNLERWTVDSNTQFTRF